MSTLRIYADEAGPIPVDSDTDSFVFSAVGVLDEAPEFEQKSGHREWLIERLIEFEAIPFLTVFPPYPGRSDTLSKRLQSMDFLARINRLATGSTEKYLGRDGYNLKNMLWTFALSVTVPAVFLKAVISAKIEAVEIVVDQKTLHSGLERMISDVIPKMRSDLGNVLDGLPKQFEERGLQIRENIPTGKNWISIKANNCENPFDATGGLDLAHYLASLSLKDLRKGRENSIFHQLYEAGFRSCLQDASKWGESPLHEGQIAKWEAMTGIRATEFLPENNRD